MSNIVNLLVSEQPAIQPVMLQQTGAIVSQGGTTLTPSTGVLPALGSGNTAFLSQPSDLTAILTGAQAISAITTSGTAPNITVTVTTAAAHGYPVETGVPLTITGAVGSIVANGFNGTFNATITSTTQFTYPLTVAPGTASTLGSVTDADVAQLINQVAEYFAMNSAGVGVYVLEMGPDNSTQGIVKLGTWLTANLGLFYGFLLPDNWSADATLLPFVKLYATNKAAVYFYFNSTSGNWSTYSGVKSTVNCAQSPNAASSEELAAALFAMVLNYAPSAVNKVPQAAYTFLYGVTQWPKNNTNIPTLETDNVNYAASGAEGGLSNVILKMGVYGDGTQLNNWYAIDWVNLNAHQALAATVILGSNNTIDPLYYDQKGINTLRGSAQSVLNQASQFGLLGGTPTVVAIPYTTYTTANPNDYTNGVYNGLYAIIATQKGFLKITFNVTFINLAP